MQEMGRLDISIRAIQETKSQDIVYEEHPYGHILGFPSSSKHYGNAFAVKKICGCIRMNMSTIGSQ